MVQADEVVYIGIGNSDDKLTQTQWASYIDRVHLTCLTAGEMVQETFSKPDVPWQNACFCVRVKPARQLWLERKLEVIAGQFRQDSISWAPAVTTLLRPKVESSV